MGRHAQQVLDVYSSAVLKRSRTCRIARRSIARDRTREVEIVEEAHVE